MRLHKDRKQRISYYFKAGLNRQIRRMCAACGYRVETLKRIRIMNIHLGNIPQGNFRNVTDAEFDKLIKTL